jgi:hypothetical protein
MPTDVPLSARSLGPSPGLMSRASTAEFMLALKVAEAQRVAGARAAGTAAAAAPWAGPSPPPADCAAGRASCARDRVAVTTEEAPTLSSGGCTAPGLGDWTGEVVHRTEVDGRGRPGTAEGGPAGRNNADAVCLTQRVALSGLAFEEDAAGEMGAVLAKGGSGSFPPEPRSGGFVRKPSGALYTGDKPLSPAASPTADPAVLARSGFHRSATGRPFASVSNLPPTPPSSKPKPFEGPMPAKIAEQAPFFGRKKPGEEGAAAAFGTALPSPLSFALRLRFCLVPRVADS